MTRDCTPPNHQHPASYVVTYLSQSPRSVITNRKRTHRHPSDRSTVIGHNGMLPHLSPWSAVTCHNGMLPHLSPWSPVTCHNGMLPHLSPWSPVTCHNGMLPHLSPWSAVTCHNGMLPHLSPWSAVTCHNGFHPHRSRRQIITYSIRAHTHHHPSPRAADIIIVSHKHPLHHCRTVSNEHQHKLTITGLSQHTLTSYITNSGCNPRSGGGLTLTMERQATRDTHTVLGHSKVRHRGAEDGTAHLLHHAGFTADRPSAGQCNAQTSISTVP